MSPSDMAPTPHHVREFTSQKDIHAELRRVGELAHSLARTRDIDAALLLMEEALEKYPDSFMPYCVLAEFHIWMRDLERAEGFIDQALRLAPMEVSLNRTAGYLYTESGDYEKALEHLNKAIDSPCPAFDKGYTYFHLGRLYMKQGDLDKALANLRRAAFLQPQDEYIRFTLQDLDG